MDDERFDEVARGLTSRLTRRHAGGLATGALLALGLGMDADAKKKKKKKKRKKKKNNNKGGSSAPPPSPPPVNYSCNNLGTPCGNTAVCQCRLTASTQQICLNGVVTVFAPCVSNANCPAGQHCDLIDGICRNACAN